jgi:hypothetical protein
MRRVLTFVIAALLVCRVSAQAQNGLPVAAHDALDAGFPGWRFAELAPRLARELAGGQSPAWVAGDFDGDRRLDYAVQLVAPSAPPDSVQQVVALLARRSRYEPVLIMAAGLHTGVYLGRAPKGGLVVDLQQYDDRYEPSATNGGFVLKHDGLTIYYAQEASSTCYYASPGFRCVISGD